MVFMLDGSNGKNGRKTKVSTKNIGSRLSMEDMLNSLLGCHVTTEFL